jgi:hypothetical protein
MQKKNIVFTAELAENAEPRGGMQARVVKFHKLQTG